MRALALSIFVLSIGFQTSAIAETYYVSKTGSDENSGHQDTPFLTISQAASIAEAGDTVIVHEGVYREWVDPKHSGAKGQPIVYKAAADETVIIAGSERIVGWQAEDNGIWRLDIEETAFGELNPFNSSIRHPIYIEADEAGDGWGWLKYGRHAHRGDIIINGEGLTEKETVEGLSSPLSWYTNTKDGTTSIWAHFGELDPNENDTELSIRPFAFFPSRTGISHITLDGFIVANVATHWAPPTAFQPGAIGPNGGTHWLIKNNAVLYSRGVGISIGVPTDEKGLKELGSHTIENNILLRNGQGGIAGQSWNHNSVIRSNWIEDTNYRVEFGGWETAAIKIHDAKHLWIDSNTILYVATTDPEVGAAHGVWVDFTNENTRVSRNFISGAQSAAILTEANWEGPTLIDRNVMFGGTASTYSSRQDAWVNNLFVDSAPAWEDQDWGDRIPVSDARWLNNVFLEKGLNELPENQPGVQAQNNLFLSGAQASKIDEDFILSNRDLGASFDVPEMGTLNLTLDPILLSLGNALHSSGDLDTINLPFSEEFEERLYNSEDFFGATPDSNLISAGPFANIDNTVFVRKQSLRHAKAVEHILENGFLHLDRLRPTPDEE